MLHKFMLLWNKIWNQGDKSSQIDVHIVDDTTMKFKVLNPMMRARILREGCGILVTYQWLFKNGSQMSLRRSQR